MIATVVTIAPRSHSMALTCQCRVKSAYGRNERHTFSHLEFTTRTLTCRSLPERLYRSLRYATLMTLALRPCGPPEGPSCSRRTVIRSSFSKLFLLFAHTLCCYYKEVTHSIRTI